MTTIKKDGVEAWLDSLDLDKSQMRDGSNLAKIGAALTAVEEADANLDRAIAEARAAGDSWTAIGIALGTSRQAAHRKYSGRIG